MNNLLTFDIALSLEEDLIDCLLEFLYIESFSSFEIRRHGNNDALKTIEKVTGRSKVLRFEVVIDQGKVDDLIFHVSKSVAPNIPYSISPLLGNGFT